MNNKKKLILSSSLVIAMCSTMITGATFALFTDTEETNITVNSGKVDVVSEIAEWSTWSMEELQPMNDEQTESAFENGGKAVYDEENATFTLTNVTPGDTLKATITITNKSTVKVQYRAALLINGDLADDLTVTVNGEEYSTAETILSDWTLLEVDEQPTLNEIALVIALPEAADNDAQNESATVKIRVEAVQGNAKGKYELSEDYNDDLTIIENQIAEWDLNNYAINGEVINYGQLTAIGGTINKDGAGFENHGTATLTDVNMKAGDPSNYSNITYGGATTVYNNVNIDSAGGGVGVTNGGTVTFNSGSVAVNSASTSGRYNFYAEGENSVIIINGGEFSFSKTLNQKRAYIYAGAGTTVYVNGGTFGAASTRDGYTAGILGDGEVIITGGTFGFNPSNWVADGYQAVKTGDGWVVSAI